MPHIVIEYSGHMDETHDMNEVCAALFKTAADSGVFHNTSAIKVRAIPCPFWCVGSEPNCFVHATIRLLDGRDLETKQGLTASVLETLDRLLPDVGSLSVDIKEITTETYAKRTL